MFALFQIWPVVNCKPDLFWHYFTKRFLPKRTDFWFRFIEEPKPKRLCSSTKKNVNVFWQQILLNQRWIWHLLDSFQLWKLKVCFQYDKMGKSLKDMNTFANNIKHILPGTHMFLVSASFKYVAEWAWGDDSGKKKRFHFNTVPDLTSSGTSYNTARNNFYERSRNSLLVKKKKEILIILF